MVEAPAPQLRTSVESRNWRATIALAASGQDHVCALLRGFATFQSQFDKIKAMQGTAFDAAYLRAMEDVHAKDGAAFAKEAKQGSDPKLKAFVAETYRIVQRHIGELKALGPS